MFKKFDEKESVSGVQQLKSSVQKGIRSKLLEQFPYLESYIDIILPKKDIFRIVKCHDHIEIIVNGSGELLFFRHREGPWMPTLRLLHKYPFILPWQQVDKGAIRFVLSGANIMCPGLTSPGAIMTPSPKGTVVAVMAEGKQHALAVGITTLSTEDIDRWYGRLAHLHLQPAYFQPNWMSIPEASKSCRELIKCGYKVEPFGSKSCFCEKSALACTALCLCKGHCG